MTVSRRSFLLGSGCLATLVLEGACGSRTSGSGTGVTIVTGTSATPTPTPTLTPTATPTPTPTASARRGVVVQVGDSIGLGFGADYYAAIEHLELGSGVIIHNVSANGRTLLNGYQLASSAFAFRDTSQPCVLLIEQGTNDLSAWSTTARGLYEDAAKPFVTAAKAAGFRVVISTILPRNDAAWSPAKEQERLAYNAMLRADRAGADGINDVAADSVIGDGSGVPTAYYADGLHPTLLGQRRLATIIAPVIAGMLTTASA